jgi:hypothetical protein
MVSGEVGSVGIDAPFPFLKNHRMYRNILIGMQQFFNKEQKS